MVVVGPAAAGRSRQLPPSRSSALALRAARSFPAHTPLRAALLDCTLELEGDQVFGMSVSTATADQDGPLTMTEAKRGDETYGVFYSRSSDRSIDLNDDQKSKVKTLVEDAAERVKT